MSAKPDNKLAGEMIEFLLSKIEEGEEVAYLPEYHTIGEEYIMSFLGEDNRAFPVFVQTIMKIIPESPLIPKLVRGGYFTITSNYSSQKLS